MSASSYTVQLPAGTNRSVVLNVGYPGSWPGGIWISFGANVSWTVTLLKGITQGVAPPYKTRDIKHTGTGATAPYTVAALYRTGVYLRHGEAIINITYTSTADVSCNIETNTQAKPEANP